MRWPVLFVSHGSPMLALEPGRAGAALAAWPHGRERPSAILAISPHWYREGLAVATRERQRAWHDFGGFPAELYRLSYGPPGSPSLAARVQGLLAAQGVAVAEDPARPLDHGVWGPLRFLYPDADVPVVALALDGGRDAGGQYLLGRMLRPLRDEGVLIVASGSLTHNLRHVQAGHDAAPLPYVQAFQQWVADRLAAADTAALLAWQARAPGAAQAHPHDEHLMPLFVAWGAAEGRATRLVDEVAYGALAMDAYELD
ncbi:DODA-type extradiol aromatic ring-opening family dioxygenase [Bordetella bronchialis]|uniref:Dioxygenase n=1 Tax=Bordetella bronchialis TaxID=463025 RepID=A0A193FVA5_9BORD|nr:class III extradiol ring-cleavage dioxygenase [Bordetella bronchialis]ANN71268.1 dioxygenase [Bordetella bronchialis]